MISFTSPENIKISGLWMLSQVIEIDQLYEEGKLVSIPWRQYCINWTPNVKDIFFSIFCEVARKKIGKIDFRYLGTGYEVVTCISSLI